MGFVAIKMLMGDRGKYLGLVFAIGFASMLMANQMSTFVGVLRRTTSQIEDVRDGAIWVMDARVRYVEEIEPLSDREVYRVRGVEGVAWAVRLLKGTTRIQTKEGGFRSAILMGIDDASLVGSPRRMKLGSTADLRRPDAVVIDEVGYTTLWPGEPLALGRTVEMNDRHGVLVGIADSSPSFGSLPVLYTRYSQAVQYLGRQRNQMSFVVAQPAPGVAVPELLARIRARTGLAAHTRDEFAWHTVGYYLRNTAIPVNFGITVSLAFIVGAVVAGQTFYLFTVENLKQFGALKAIGVSNRRIVGMILLQALIVGVAGYAIGMGLAASFFEATKGFIHLRGFFLLWEVMLATGVAVLGIVALASVLSVRRVLVLEPAAVFR